ncbi:MAG: PRC-barrel domain-containing protein, partial [Geminicoccaceae bacterium]|nr:PRC-barrel domain-containing protein [Geminicoccaceae bacterium]
MVAKLIASTAALALMSGIALAQDATKPPADAMPADAANRAKTTVESGSDAAAGGAARMQEGTETAQDSLKAGEGTAQDSSEKAPPATMADGTKGADTPMVTTAGADGAAQSGILFSQSEGETLTEEIIGADVRNAEDESIGEIKALVLDENMAVKGAIVGVGGFLGIG